MIKFVRYCFDRQGPVERRNTPLAQLLALFFLACAALVFLQVKNDQNWGGDWAQYLIHAENLLDGSGYLDGLEGFSAAPLGFVVLLAALLLVPLPIFFTAQALQFIFVLFICLLILRACQKAGSFGVGIFFASLIFLNSNVQAAVYQIGPDVLFACTVVSFAYLPMKSKTSVILLAFSCATRVEGILLLVPILVDKGLSQRERAARLFVGGFVWLLSIWGLAAATSSPAYGTGHSSVRTAVRTIFRPSDFVENAEILRDVISQILSKYTHSVFGQGSSVPDFFLVIIGIIILVGITNFTDQSRCRVTLVWSFLIFLVPIGFSFAVGGEGGLPPRYFLVPGILSVGLLAEWVAGLVQKQQFKSKKIFLGLAASLLLVSASLSVNTRAWYHATDFESDVGRINSSQMIGFFKPRTLEFALREVNDSHGEINVVLLRSTAAAESLINGSGCAIGEKTSMHGQDIVLPFLRENLPLAVYTFENSYRLIACF